MSGANGEEGQESAVEAIAAARACTVCAPHLPLAPRPVFRIHPSARVLIVSQAPGTRAHESVLPFDDASGDRLRGWLGIGRDLFYDETRLALMPMGFCYPGKLPRGGDRPPRPECAPLWRARLHPHLSNVRLTLLVGRYGQVWYLGARAKRTLTDTVAAFREYLPDYIPTPHPSWRTNHWAKRNPWFEAEVLPELRRRVHALIGG